MRKPMPWEPWWTEPVLDIFEFWGVLCRLGRNPHGLYYTGYVQVSSGHKWHGVDYSDIRVRVHGGLTWSNDYCPLERSKRAGEWWIGFDCAHYGDFQPGLETSLAEIMPGHRPDPAAIYRDIDYVRSQLRLLAAQVSSSWADGNLWMDGKI